LASPHDDDNGPPLRVTTIRNVTSPSHTVSGLTEKRREIVGQIEHARRELHNLVVMLDHLDATIRVYRGGADVGRKENFGQSSSTNDPPRLHNDAEPHLIRLFT
jgi:hypothetical protein